MTAVAPPAATLSTRGRRVHQQLDLVSGHLAVQVHLLLDDVSPPLHAHACADCERRPAVAGPPDAPSGTASIIVDPDGEGLRELTARAATRDRMACVPIPRVGATLVVHARRDLPRDLPEAARVIAELVAQMIGGRRSAAPPVVPTGIGGGQGHA